MARRRIAWAMVAVVLGMMAVLAIAGYRDREFGSDNEQDRSSAGAESGSGRIERKTGGH
ncbi:MAG: hypothetical protein JXB46_11680 [Candidatus Eisenbacteria bacterium]|nr:hypothetical protein [Candidatus Eisenbacteria bacterium]